MDGYTFDPGSFQRVRNAWNDIRAGLEQDQLRAAGILDAVKAPGHEPASGFVAETQNTSGAALLSSISTMKAFADSYLSSLDRTEQDYLTREDHNSRLLQKEGR